MQPRRRDTSSGIAPVESTAASDAGTVSNIQVPGGGNLLLDAGKVVIDLSTDPPTFRIAGPHQQFLGDVADLCEYFAAP
jgi:hypothetical protein